MEDGRDGDIRVPLISSLFCIFVLAGGVFLVLYVFKPDVSRPWFPVVALILIGSPWIFWLLTYLYTCIKGCCRGGGSHDRQISRRGGGSTMTNRAGSISNHSPATGQNTSREESGRNGSAANGGERHVHFGEVVVVEEGEGSHRSGHGTESSVNSAKEIEMPLNRSPSS